jgi:hypothetical protein
LYSPLEHRGYSDVDLLVAPSDIDGARQILAALGYMSLTERLGIDEIGRNLDAETWVRVGASADAGLMIDLHQQLAGSHASPQAAWDALRRRRTWLDLDGARVPALNPEGLALHVAIHAAQHGTRYPQPMEDLVKAIERWSPEVWRGAARLARELHATAIFAAGLRQVPQGALVALELGLPATDDLQWAIAHRGERPRGTFHLEALIQAASMGERASVLRRALLPSRKWIVWQYPWARANGVRLAGAYVAHLARTPLWAACAWRFRRRAQRET